MMQINCEIALPGLFLLAQKAREEGHPDTRRSLTRWAGEVVGQAVTVERRRVAHSELAH